MALPGVQCFIRAAGHGFRQASYPGDVSSPQSGLVPVHIGQAPPGSASLPPRQRLTGAAPSRVPPGLAWQTHGLDPRWLGMETSDCAVALEPSIYHGRGADELKRFVTGAQRRGEPALVVAIMGLVDGDTQYNVFNHSGASVYLGSLFTSVAGRRLPAGTRPSLAPGLDGADRDLALRLLARDPLAPWWALRLTGTTMHHGDGSGLETYEPEGTMQPILVDPLGEPVVAAWTPPAGDQRWYVIPDGTDWETVLGWLVHQALPAHAPNALRRARSPHFVDPQLQTRDELAARQAVADLEARYAEDKARVDEDLRRAQAAAEPIRYQLLYGSGPELATAVAAVLAAAGLSVTDLDEELGATKSADLLVCHGTQRLLVEVKAAGGAAGEHLVGHLERHLATWPQLRPDQPVTGGVLVVNHQHKLPPSMRPAQVYTRPEFVASLTAPVVSAVELFNLWRNFEWALIRAAVLGTDSSSAAGDSSPSPADPPTMGSGGPRSAPATPRQPTRWRLWR